MGILKKIWQFFETLIPILLINKMFSKGCMKIHNAHILSIKISEKQQCEPKNVELKFSNLFTG